ncbi:MAG: hypothetical protein KDN19_23610, partial [Verrucomicrobiae bacterium]|nr:hypothetical protein [Verrucomicrobiae bacterium]
MKVTPVDLPVENSAITAAYAMNRRDKKNGGILWQRLWFGTDRGDLICLDWGAETLKARWSANSAIVSMTSDSLGRLWVVTKDDGVFCLNQAGENENGQMEPVALKGGEILKTSEVKGIAIDERLDEDGALESTHYWFATNHGLRRMDGETGRWTSYRHDPLDPGSPLASQIPVIFKDRRDVLWIGFSSGGVSRFSLRKNWFARFPLASNHETGLSHRAIFAVDEDSRGNVWIGTADGLDLWNPETGHFQNHVLDQALADRELFRKQVSSIVHDGHGRVWVGTRQDGLLRIESLKRGGIRRFVSSRTEAGALPGNAIKDLCIDADGVLWIATDGEGICRFDEGSESFRRFGETSGEGLDRVVNTIFSDREGRIWIGTGGHGMGRLDVDHDRIESVEPLGTGEVNAIAEDASGHLWVGITGRGISRFDPASGSVITLSQRNSQIPGDDVMAIVNAGDNSIWAGTRDGLARIDAENFQQRIFDEHDGLQSDWFHPRAAAVGSDGTLLFGGPNGLNLIDPGRLPEPRLVERPVLLGLTLEGREVKPAAGGVLEKPLNVTDVIKLPQGRNLQFTLRFATLDYATPNR